VSSLAASNVDTPAWWRARACCLVQKTIDAYAGTLVRPWKLRQEFRKDFRLHAPSRFHCSLTHGYVPAKMVSRSHARRIWYQTIGAMLGCRGVRGIPDDAQLILPFPRMDEGSVAA
jgi:hypothetical protein